MSQVNESLDKNALTEYLASRLPELGSVETVEKFSGGQSNPTYMVTAQGGCCVLRRQPFGKLLPSAHAVDREFRVLKALSETDVPTAKPLHLCEDPSVIGSMFYLMSYEPGRIFWDAALPELPKDARHGLYEETIRVMAAMHDVDVQAAGLADYGRAEGFYQRQLTRWTKQYRAAQTEEMPDMERLITWLDENMPAEDGQVSLIHGDFRFDNIIFDNETLHARAVLDWELSTVGHPLSDLAYFCMALRLPSGGHVSGLAGVDRAAEGLPTEEEIIARYCGYRNIERIDHWAFYLAMSLFRLASICQGVYKRALDGNASNTKALENGNLAVALVDIAMALIDKEG